MADLDKAIATQIKNIESRTGRSMDELISLVRNSGLAKHGEIVAMLKQDLGVGHGDANLIAHQAKQASSAPKQAPDDPLDALYVGPKAALRPIHEALLAHMNGFGNFETAPKQKYVSYRRKKQFAMIGPATNTRVEVGLNARDLPESPRLEKLPAGQMCNYRVRLGDAAEVDAELMGWMRIAYTSAG